MPTIDYGKQQTAAPLSYQQGKNTSNTTSQLDITLNPPDPRTGLVVTGLFADIVCTGTGTTITLRYDGVDQFTWTASGGVLQLSISGPAAFATALNQSLVIRLNADATRTRSIVGVTTATVRL